MSARKGAAADWTVIAQREIGIKLRDKVFVGSTIFMLVVLIASIGLSTFFDSRVDEPRVAAVGAEAVAVVDRANEIAEAQDQGIDAQATEVADTTEGERLVGDGEADVLLAAAGDGWEVVGEQSVDPSLEQLLTAAVASVSLEANADSAGTTVDELTQGSTVEQRLLDEDALPEAVKYIVTFVFAFLFYLTALTFGIAIAQSVVEEKQSRVVEILAAAIPVRQLLIGKVVGNSALAIAQVVVMVGVGLLAMALTGQGELLAPVVAAGGWFVVFFLLGFAAVACVWAVAGSVATRSEDLQATTMPVTFVVMGALFAGIFASGKWLVIASFVPLVSSVAMPVRLLAGDVPLWQPVVSGLLVLAAAAVLVRVGARLYEGSLLRTERRTTLKEAFASTR